MWVGWNSKVIYDPLRQQRIGSLSQINESLTHNNVVVETLRRSLEIVNEVGMEYITVTYDLAIAKVAFSIQSEESPKFDRLFIMLGAFHIQMAFFNVIGKYVDHSGSQHIQKESSVLAEGSQEGFILGKYFNRCKRVHPLLSAAIELLHLSGFTENNDIPFSTVDVSTPFDSSMLDADLNMFYKGTRCIQGKLKMGNMGTAKYWFGYVNLVKLYHKFVRSIHTCNLELFIRCLGEMASYFFVLISQITPVDFKISR